MSSRLSIVKAAFASFVRADAETRRMYGEKNKRAARVSLSTRQNPAWGVCSVATIGDTLVLKRRGIGETTHKVENIITERGNTHLILSGNGEVINFSWKDARDIGVTALRFASDAEAAAFNRAAQTSTKRKKAAAKATARRSKPAQRPTSAAIVNEARKGFSAIASGKR